MAARLQFQRRAYLGALTVALLGALLVLVSPATPVSAATASQYASSWTVDNNANWTPAPPSANPLGSTTANCTGGTAAGPTIAWAEFTFSGFAIPAGDQIDGIVVTPKYRTAATTATIALRDGGVQVGSKTFPQNTGPANCNGTSTVAVGGATDTWGATLTPAQVNDGIQVRITFTNTNLDLDNIQLTVHHSTPAPEADLGVTISDDVDPATPGESVVYTIVASNTGPDPDPAASLTNSFPADTTCSFTSTAAGGALGNTPAGTGDLAETLVLLPGSTVTYTATCAIDPGATNFLSHTAEISASVDDPSDANDTASETTDLVPEADISITKSDDATTAVPGESTTYEIVVDNAGPSDDPSILVTDDLPDDLDCDWTAAIAGPGTGALAGSGDISETIGLDAGSTAVYTVVCDIDAAATGDLSNTATAAASVSDPDDGNDSATDVDTLTPESDLSVSIAESADPVTAGDAAGLTYTVTVQNDGPSVAENAEVEVTLTLPTGVTPGTASATGGSFAGTTWSVGSLAPGDDETLTLPLEVGASTAAGADVIAVEASSTSDSTDVDDSDDTATEATSVESAPVEPTTTTATTTTTTTTIAGRVDDAGTARGGASPSGALPRTGGSVGPLVLLGLLSMLGGGITVWSAERRNAYVGSHLR